MVVVVVVVMVVVVVVVVVMVVVVMVVVVVVMVVVVVVVVVVVMVVVVVVVDLFHAELSPERLWRVPRSRKLALSLYITMQCHRPNDYYADGSGRYFHCVRSVSPSRDLKARLYLGRGHRVSVINTLVCFPRGTTPFPIMW